ncbi:MAG: amidase, partial [Dehalococcoidia bacterium]|nr:amidase [Dehalococcoidia bacterium]
MTATKTTSDLAELTASEAAAAVRSGDVSPVDLVEALLARVDAYDDRVKAWTYLDRDYVRAEARQLADEAARGKFRGPLHGVPVAFKDVFHVAGMPTRADSKATDDTLVEHDCTLAARLRDAGALIMGKLHTAEFAASLLQPYTRNPWNTDHNAGGSSSGSGAAVGARMAMAAFGTQTGGSNNRPAAYCGVSGFIASYGRVSRYGLLANSWSNDHPGILARSVDDLALVFSVIGGEAAEDPTTLPVSASPADLAMSGYRPPRIGVFREFFEPLAEPAMTACLDEAAGKLEAAGATLVNVPMPETFPLAAKAGNIVSQSEKATVHARLMAHRAADYGGPLRASNEAGQLIPAAYYLHAQRIRGWLSREMTALFTGCDLLLLPTAPGPAPAGRLDRQPGVPHALDSHGLSGRFHPRRAVARRHAAGASDRRAAHGRLRPPSRRIVGPIRPRHPGAATARLTRNELATTRKECHRWQIQSTWKRRSGASSSPPGSSKKSAPKSSRFSSGCTRRSAPPRIASTSPRSNTKNPPSSSIRSYSARSVARDNGPALGQATVRSLPQPGHRPADLHRGAPDGVGRVGASRCHFASLAAFSASNASSSPTQSKTRLAVDPRQGEDAF